MVGGSATSVRVSQRIYACMAFYPPLRHLSLSSMSLHTLISPTISAHPLSALTATTITT